MKTAKTVDEQIDILRSRGIIINDSEKAKEILHDIGYYRLGFYFFPFEQTHPQTANRTHNVVPGTLFEDAVALYYFDFDLRNILNRYLTRVEVAFRTYLTYYMSLQYKTDPLWFVSPTVVIQSFINDFDRKVYQSEAFRKNQQIKRHHNKYPADKYAPAWKTIEFMTFGSIVRLYKSIDNKDDKKAIARNFGVGKSAVFTSYIDAIYTLRNKCAHGSALFDLQLPNGISAKGPKLGLAGADCQNLNGAITVLQYVLKQISQNRANDLQKELDDLYARFKKQRVELVEILKKCSGLNF